MKKIFIVLLLCVCLVLPHNVFASQYNSDKLNSNNDVKILFNGNSLDYNEKKELLKIDADLRYVFDSNNTKFSTEYSKMDDNDIVESISIKRIEEKIIEDRKEKEIYIYFDVKYKDNNYNKIKFNSSKQNLIFRYNTNDIPPQMGDSRIVVTCPYDLDFETFDRLNNCTKQELEQYILSKASKYVLENIIKTSSAWSLFTKFICTAMETHERSIADVIYYETERFIRKKVEIYDGLYWNSYIQSSQKEVYWKQEIKVKDSDGFILARLEENITPEEGYLPIEWYHNSEFYNNKSLINQAFIRYENDLGLIKDSGILTHSSTNWKRRGAINYD